MKTSLYDEMFLQEKSYWWHVAKRSLVHKAMENNEKNYRILDAGCGTGAMLEELKNKYKYCYGADSSSKSLAYCEQRGIKNLKLVNFENGLPFRSGYFNTITCLDVLEHVTKDTKLLREFYRILAPGGMLYLTVPAYKLFWTYWDEMLNHKRRYRRSALVEKLKTSGFKVERSSYFYSFLIPIVLAFRLVKSMTKNYSSDFVGINPILNSLLLLLCKFERVMVFNFFVPFGLSIFIEGKKKI